MGGGGILAAGQEKEGELATKSLGFEYLHRKSRYKILIGGDDIPLSRVFSRFVYIRARFRFALIVGNLTAQSTESLKGIGGGIQIPEERRSCKLSFLFPPRHQSAPGSLLAGYEKISVGHSWTTLWNLTLTQFLNITAESELLLSMTIPGLSTSLTCLSSCTSCMLL